MTHASKKEPIISVIVPVYRTESYLRKCLDSLIGQTYRNLEIILVDDGSPDHCGEICDEYAGKDSRIQVIHQENGGVSSARNAGLRAASGEWIGWVDSDDWIEPDMFEYLLSGAYEHKADILQCGLFWEERNFSEPVFVRDETRLVSGGIDHFLLADWREFSNQIYNKLYKASLIKGCRFHEAYKVGEDLHFNLQALDRAEKILFMGKAKYHYWQREDSLCHKVESKEELLGLHQVLRFALEKFADYPSAEQNFKEMLLRDALDISSKLVYFNSDEKKSLRKEVQKELRLSLWKMMPGFSLKEKAKAILIVYFWPVYEGLVRFVKNR